MTVHPRMFLILTLGLLASSSSLGGIIYGNPTSKIVLDSGGAVEIGTVHAYSCPGNETEVIDDRLTTSTTLYATFSEGTWCDLYIQVQWNGESTYDDVQVSGFTSFVTDGDDPQRTIRLYPTTKTAVLE